MSSTKPPRTNGPSGEHPAVVEYLEKLDDTTEIERMARVRKRLERLSGTPPAEPAPPEESPKKETP